MRKLSIRRSRRSPCFGHSDELTPWTGIHRLQIVLRDEVDEESQPSIEYIRSSQFLPLPSIGISNPTTLEATTSSASTSFSAIPRHCRRRGPRPTPPKLNSRPWYAPIFVLPRQSRPISTHEASSSCAIYKKLYHAPCFHLDNICELSSSSLNSTPLTAILPL
jgi:hypothetical protein